MTMTIKHHKKNGYYVTLDIEKEGFYVVQACPCHNNGDFDYCGYPERKITYVYNEKKKAEATFKRYVKKYCKGE